MTRRLLPPAAHGRDGAPRPVPEPVLALPGEVDVTLHAGDIVGAQLLAELAERAPVHAVLGNNDGALAGRLPETRLVDLDGVSVAMIHDSGPRAGRAARLHRRFPSADVVVFGHSHIPLDQEGIDAQRLFNPGSPTQRRRQPRHTVGLLEAVAGRLVRHEIVAI